MGEEIYYESWGVECLRLVVGCVFFIDVDINKMVVNVRNYLKSWSL